MTRNKQGRFTKRHTFIFLALIFVWIIVLANVKRFYKAWYDSIELVDPRASFVIPKAHASEYDIVLFCDKDVVSYIKCKFHSGELTESEAITLIAIAKAESGLNEKAKNKQSSAKGVFQILSGSTWHDYGCRGEIYEWKDNTNCAIKIMKRSGFTPWDAFNRGMHIKYLSEVTI